MNTLIPNQMQISPSIISGGQPDLHAFNQAKEAGFSHVINMRAEGEQPDPMEEKSVLEDLGFTYHFFPIAGSEDLTPTRAKEFADLLKSLDGQQVLIHCGSGNRVGAIFALIAFFIDGKTVRESIEAGVNAGLTGLEPMVRQILEAA